ncbi:MAG: hypothetical protein NVS3B25_23040 [Hymenobacter sp.]
MSPKPTVIKVYVERYRHVAERLLAPNNHKEGRYQELEELLYFVAHDEQSSPDEEARRLIEALKAGGVVRPRYYALGGQPEWVELTAGNFSDT